MHLSQMFNKNSYVYNGRFNSSFMGSVLTMLKMSQHLYRREDIVAAYRYLADVIENGDFPWGGTFELLERPAQIKKPLRNSGKVVKMSADKDSEKPIASESADTTPSM